MPDMGEVKVGALVLRTPSFWKFYEFTNLILGRRDDGVGTLQISTAFRFDLPDGSLPAAAAELARQWVQGPVGAFDTEGCLTIPFGMARLSDEAGWVWYLLKQGQVILATYQPRDGDVARGRMESERHEISLILRSAEWTAG